MLDLNGVTKEFARRVEAVHDLDNLNNAHEMVKELSAYVLRTFAPLLRHANELQRLLGERKAEYEDLECQLLTYTQGVEQFDAVEPPPVADAATA